MNDIKTAKHRAARNRKVTNHGRVVAELTFGFWRYLCTSNYLTALWIPVLGQTFVDHPATGDPRVIRADVEDRIQRIHFLRNRIAHHEPIHQRDLKYDFESVVDVAGWLCPDTATWISQTSRTLEVLSQRPEL